MEHRNMANQTTMEDTALVTLANRFNEMSLQALHKLIFNLELYFFWTSCQSRYDSPFYHTISSIAVGRRDGLIPLQKKQQHLHDSDGLS